MKLTYGATHNEWMHFAFKLKLMQDLLPVVSNPNAEISPMSKMKDKGKTPSRYNGDHKVVGIPAWTEVNADARDITKWSKDRDYGICLQSRLVRGIDIDVAGSLVADAIEEAVRNAVPGVHFPKRFRSNSGKCLLAFAYPGELYKRSFPIGDERVELLATGQQFVAVGLHPSGVPYQWDGGLPEGFPVLNEEEVETLWSTLELLFATGSGFAASARRERERSPSGEGDSSDDVAAYLLENGLIAEDGIGGQLHIECPWKAEHSGDSGVTETSYFPAGTGGFEMGHFRCLHDHCSGRTDEEFLDAIGFNADVDFRARDFPDIESVEIATLPADKAPSRIPPLLVDGYTLDRKALEKIAYDPIIFDREKIGKNQGKIKPNRENMTRAFASPAFSTRKFARDQFLGDICWAGHNEADCAEAWRPWKDNEYWSAGLTLEMRGFIGPVPVELMRSGIEWAADRREIDTAMIWLDKQEWDGVPRCERFLVDYMGADDSPYVRAVGRYLWSALAGRVLQPGVQADMAVILKSGQGKAKTTAVKALVPFDEWFAEIDLSLSDADLARQMRGKVVCELAELSGLQTRESGHIKKFISAPADEWIPKYKERAHSQPRRCLFFGTTNEEEFLADPTGERRWLPVQIEQGDVAAVRRDRAQLWAEAALRFDMLGVEYADAERLARTEIPQWKVTDALEDEIEAWANSESLGGGSPATDGFRLSSLIEGCTGTKIANVKRTEQKRYKGALQTLGYKEVQTSRCGVSCRMWKKMEK